MAMHEGNRVPITPEPLQGTALPADYHRKISVYSHILGGLQNDSADSASRTCPSGFVADPTPRGQAHLLSGGTMSRICALGHAMPDGTALCPACGLGELPSHNSHPFPEPVIAASEPAPPASTPITAAMPLEARAVFEEALPGAGPVLSVPLPTQDNQQVSHQNNMVHEAVWEEHQIPASKAVQAPIPHPPPPPQISPDGRFWWDGAAWQPMAGGGNTPPVPPAIIPDTSHRFGCLRCRSTFSSPKKYVGGSFGAELILWLFFLLPGLIYSVWRLSSKADVCPACMSKDIIRLETPEGRRMLGMAA